MRTREKPNPTQVSNRVYSQPTNTAIALAAKSLHEDTPGIQVPEPEPKDDRCC